MQPRKQAKDWRICTSCGVKRPLAEFHFHNKDKNEKKAKCKSCVSAYGKTYTEKNKAVIKEKNRIRYEKAAKEKINGKLTKLYKTCAGCGVEKYYKDFGLKANGHGSGTKSLRHRCLACEQDRKRETYLRDKDKILEARKHRSTEQKKTANQRTQIWRLANPQKVAKHKASANTLRLQRLAEQSDGTLNRTVLKRLLDEAKTCPVCHRMFSSIIKKSLDHIKPISKGGLHSINNVRICCLTCNLQKGANDCQ